MKKASLKFKPSALRKAREENEKMSCRLRDGTCKAQI